MDNLKFQSLLHWLAAGAPPQADFSATVAELGRHMVDAGIELDFVGIYTIPLNPLLGGIRCSWEPEAGINTREFTHEMMASEQFIGGAIHSSQQTGKPVRYRVGAMPEFDNHPGSVGIIRAGFREFINMPFQMTTKSRGSIALGVRRQESLPDDQYDASRRLVAPLARVVQSQIQADSTNALLASFLGRDAGARVSAGMVRRGDAEMIRAVILFTDLADYTELSNRLSIRDTVDHLNRYFEALEAPILRNSGEILKLMGDGMLAVFPTPDDITAEEGAALSALSAVADARAALEGSDIRFRVAYHVGEIHYGNIGGQTRLDFTAIGPAVNLASRLLQAGARAGVEATCSAAFARLVPDHARDLGTFDLKGFAEPQPVFDAS